MKRIPLITITPIIKVQILGSLASWKALLIPYLHKKIQKISIHHHLKPSCPKQQWPKFGHCGPSGVKRKKRGEDCPPFLINFRSAAVLPSMR
jgi:hypothetical protein